MSLHTNPLIGSGFASTLLVPWIAAEAEEIGLPHVHNGYLQTYVDTGMIGVFLSADRALQGGQKCHPPIVGEYHGWPSLFMALFFIGLFYNYTEVAFNRSATLGLFVAHCGVWNCPNHAGNPGGSVS